MSVASLIAVSGMTVASLRLQVSASNVANAASNGPLFGSANAESFASAYVPLRLDQTATVSSGTSATVGTISPGAVPRFDPTALYADQNGLVSVPNVDLASEILQQILARYTFAANAQVVRADAQMTATLFNLTA